MTGAPSPSCKRYANHDWSKLIADRVGQFDDLYWEHLPEGSQKQAEDTAAVQ
jgi:hypothetical protein